MSEDLSPGGYVEETSFRPGSVEGVPTSTLGMVGTTEYGPVPHPSNDGKRVRGPVLVTSMTGYERVYGGLTNRGGPAGSLWLRVRSSRTAGSVSSSSGSSCRPPRVRGPAPRTTSREWTCRWARTTQW